MSEEHWVAGGYASGHGVAHAEGFGHTPGGKSRTKNTSHLTGDSGSTSGGGSGGHTERACVLGTVDMPAGGVWTAYIKKDLSDSQLVAAVPVTGSLVCICWFNPRNTTETVSFPRRRKSGDTDWINRTGF